MSTIERLTDLLASDKLTPDEKQTIRDAIRLITGFQADRVAAYQAKQGGAA